MTVLIDSGTYKSLFENRLWNFKKWCMAVLRMNEDG